MKFHIVHSVKGGSGKTTYSLLKAIDLATPTEKHPHPKVLYFDADFKGTAIKTLIYGKDVTAFSSIQNLHFYDDIVMKSGQGISYMQGKFVFKKEYVANTLNDYLHKKETNLTDVLVKGGFEGVICTEEHEDSSEDGLIANLDFVFSSPFSEQKSMFSCASDRNELEQLDLGIYYKRMQKLFGEIKSCGYTDVVLDMMPGEDNYSKELLRVINEFNTCDKKGEVQVYFYAITTNDLTHIDAEFEAMAYRLRTRSKWKPYEKYIIVFNRLRDDEFLASLETCCTQLKEMLEARNKDVLDRVFYTSCKYHHSYYEFCRKSEQKEFDYSLEEKIEKLLEV